MRISLCILISRNFEKNWDICAFFTNIKIFRFHALYQATNLTFIVFMRTIVQTLLQNFVHALNFAKIMALNFLYMHNYFQQKWTLIDECAIWCATGKNYFLQKCATVNLLFCENLLCKNCRLLWKLKTGGWVDKKIDR